MIHSLYARVILLFLLVAALCFAFAALIMKHTYEEQRLELLHEAMIQNGASVIADLSGLDSEDAQRARIEELNSVSPYRFAWIPDIDGSGPAEVVKRGEISGLSIPDEVSVELPAQLGVTAYRLIVAQSFGGVSDPLGSVLDVFQTGGFVFLILCSLAIAAATMLLVRPIKRLVMAVNWIAEGEYAVRVPVDRRDELGELARSIVTMSGQLQRIESMRQQFVSNVSHEIRSPLTSIKGFSAELARDSLPPDTRKHYAEIVTLECERLSRLSEGLLRLAALDAQQLPYNPSVIRLDELLRRVVISIEPLISAKELLVEANMDEVVIQADADLLTQVWLNVLSNSIKFTPAGGMIRITLTRKGGEAHVRIADTGIGIPEAHLDRLFERFYKADSSRNRNSSGSGLGLSIVHGIVALHGGRIVVRSEQEQGTEVTVTLPG